MNEQSPIELVIGCSFGISPTCAPGALNERIASYIAKEQCEPGRLFVGVQWEIEDALLARKATVSRDCVVTPPAFQETDIALDSADRVRLNELLSSAVLRDASLSQAIGEINFHRSVADVFAFPNRTVAYLNRLLQDGELFRRFDTYPLWQFKKAKGGRKWEVSRRAPSGSAELGKYQTRCLNRLILETRLPGLRRAPYIGTIDVTDSVLKDVQRRGLAVERVRVYAHPAHVGRCRIQTLESAWKIGIELAPSSVEQIPCGDSILDAEANWDAGNGQEWVRSWENWKLHEGI